MGTDPHHQIAELSSRKRALLKQILSRSGDSDVPAARESRAAPLAAALASLNVSAPIPVVSRQGTILVSLAQQRLWFLDQLEPASSAFNIPIPCRVRGPLDVGALERSFEELLARHESLRTTFEEVEGRPVQVISANPCLKVRAEDLQSLPRAEREAKALALMNEESDRPFDLARGPLLRVIAIRMGPEEHILTTVVHHIVSDTWSIEVLSRDVAAFYQAISTGGPAPDLPPLPIQYADFACWQRDSTQGEVLESELSYWKRTLDGLTPLLDLPTDHPRPATWSYRGAGESVVLPLSLAEQLRRLSRQHGVTLFTTLLAAFQTLLHRYSGQEDIAVGISVAGRSRAEIEELIGFFVNTLVLRTSLSGNPTVSELLARVHEVTLGAFDHQSVPFEQVVEELRPERDPSRSPLIQVMFTLENVPRKAAPGSDNRITSIELEVRTARFDLSLHVTELPDGLNVRIEYSTDLFQSSTIVRMLGHLQTLLEEFVADPDRPIWKLRLLTPAERRQLLVDWNRTESSYPSHRCIHELFEEQVEKTPEAVAVSFEDQQLSYRELNHRANQLAYQLRGLGVGPEVVVGICAERSLELIVGLLGILKAGGAYVPLDPENPQERLAFMLKDADAQVLLTQTRFVKRLPKQQAQLLCLDVLPERDGGVNTENPTGGAKADNSAYVIYTSGSTGLPKGVTIPHRSLVNYSYWVNACLVSQHVNHIPLISSLSYDGHLKQIFAPLVRGSDVWILPQGIEIQPPALLKALAERSNVGLNCVVSLWRALIAEIESDGRPTLQQSLSAVFLGGEPLAQEVFNRSLELLPDLQVWNLYGPSEATATSTFTRLRRGNAVTIGRPLANAQIYLLDRCLNPVPIGVFGDLHVGGDGLARGYLNRPELTAEKFIPNPFSDEPGARLFKTGDLARYLPDGNIEILGRVDGQVKIRGVRIELGEIEAVLAKHPSVDEVAVVVNEHETGDKRLVAYVVSGSKQRPQTADLREFLKTKLPVYMRPSHFVFLDALPLAPSGKVDRRALPAPQEEQLGTRSATMGPRDEIEARLTTIWETALGVRSVGPRDNFFDLGGHSLLAVSLFRHIEKAFGRHIPLVALFKAPTIEGIAAILRGGDQPLQRPSLVPLQPHGTNPPFFCVHANDGNVLFYRDLARHMGLDQPFYALQSVGLDGTGQLLSRVDNMASRYISEIRSVQPEGPYHLGGFCFGAYVALEMAHQLQTEGEEVALLVSLNTDGLWKTVGSFGEGVRIHVKNLRSADLGGKLRYIAGRLAYRRWWANVMIASARLRLQQLAKRPQTSDSLAREVFEANRRASASYRSSVYRGKLTYFQASADTFDDPRPFWNKAATDGIEIHAVPGAYIGVLFEPNVKVLANRLKLCMGEVRVKKA